MTATYTFDIFTSLDGSASYGPPGDWGGYWGKQGREFLDHRLAAYEGEQRMVFGATTFGLFLQMLPALGDDERDPWMDRMLSCPTTVVSSTLQCRGLRPRPAGDPYPRRPHPGAGLPAHPPNLAGRLTRPARPRRRGARTGTVSLPAARSRWRRSSSGCVSGLLEVRLVGAGEPVLIKTRVDRLLSAPQRVDVGTIGGEAGRHLGTLGNGPVARD
jgi:hypothetical protein